MYNANTEITRKVCESITWNPYLGALKTMVRGGKIYARATLLKPNEVADFQSLDGKVIDGMQVVIMIFKRGDK